MEAGAVPLRVSLEPHAFAPPAYQSEHAAGLDVFAAVLEPLTIGPGQVAAVPTGVRLEIPRGYEAQVRPRSGLALRHRIGIPNGPGTIDADYRGEVKVLLINFGEEPYIVHRGDRIAQLVFARVARVSLTVAAALHETARGDGGFGHTGR
ncbi:MAG: dUTP diphosphatase [Candidatus Eisenbacteria bacterium]|uniref:Deoxyuridine 5'-triphosphate nucleotidohydrolase n=1 Tax=Eiseniibacteriota bacterium TaxID=2212470 RepID=A0A538T8M9_UNCEI|nr:MAG: dUTP diphosphatase [Candidatus Eisenbacteria bacterium]